MTYQELAEQAAIYAQEIMRLKAKINDLEITLAQRESSYEKSWHTWTEKGAALLARLELAKQEAKDVLEQVRDELTPYYAGNPNGSITILMNRVNALLAKLESENIR
jgi:hypothetical protein